MRDGLHPLTEFKLRAGYRVGSGAMGAASHLR